MAAELTRRLSSIVDLAIHGSRADLRFGLGMLADILLETLDALDSDAEPVRTEHESASDVIALARAAVEVLEACHVLKSSLTSSNDAYNELKLPRNRDYNTLLTFIRQDVRRAVEGKPFVYVVWSRDPERYLHVGKTQGGIHHFELDAHRNLYTALQEGSDVTLIVPSSSGTAVDVMESALRRVLHRQRALAEREPRPESVRVPPPPTCLAAFGWLLGALAV
jgi:hypothetical protein